MIKFRMRGLTKTKNHIKNLEKSLVPYSQKVLVEFAKKVSLEAQKNMQKRSGWSPTAPHYKKKNTGKHLRVASGKLKASLRGVAKGSPTEDSVFDLQVSRTGVKLTFGTKAANPRSGFSYPYFHEVSEGGKLDGRFPFFYHHASEKLLGHFADKYVNMLGGK
jgi:hypothetical protein